MTGALISIQAERVRQIEKWGADNQTHEFPVWLAILAEEVGELSQAMLNIHFVEGKTARTVPEHEVRSEAVHVAAVAVALVEQIDRESVARGAVGDH